MEFLELKGTHYEIGYSHGKAKKKEINLLLKKYNHITKDRTLFPKIINFFLPYFTHFGKHLITEIEGIAEGSEKSFEEILFLNCRHDYNDLVNNCTSFVISPDLTSDFIPIGGQNKDNTSLDSGKKLFIIKIINKENGSILGITYPGEIGPIGIGQKGVAVFGNSIYPKKTFPGAPHNLCRRVFLECSSVKECEYLLKEIGEFSAGSYTLIDRKEEIASFEVFGNNYGKINPESGIIVHANHILHPELKEYEEYRYKKDSLIRQRRLKKLLKSKSGFLTIKDCMEFLRDHGNTPYSICKHGLEESENHTVFSLIADMKNAIIYACKGYPCKNKFKKYNF